MIAKLKAVAPFVLVFLLTLGAAGAVLYLVFVREKDNQIADLATRLSTSQKTTELAQNLYAIKVTEVNNLNAALLGIKDADSKEIASLRAQLDSAKQQILTLNGLVLQWKKAYEGAVDATQTETGENGQFRKRVDFSKDFGFIGVDGYTLTDPPEGYVRVQQLRPLKLRVAVTKNKDGTWSSLVTSSEDNVGVDIDLAGVDLSVIKDAWYHNFWGTVGVGFLGDTTARLGLSYQFDRLSVGTNCSFGSGVESCGVDLGFRLFK